MSVPVFLQSSGIEPSLVRKKQMFCTRLQAHLFSQHFVSRSSTPLTALLAWLYNLPTGLRNHSSNASVKASVGGKCCSLLHRLQLCMMKTTRAVVEEPCAKLDGLQLCQRSVLLSEETSNSILVPRVGLALGSRTGRVYTGRQKQWRGIPRTSRRRTRRAYARFRTQTCSIFHCVLEDPKGCASDRLMIAVMKSSLGECPEGLLR